MKTVEQIKNTIEAERNFRAELIREELIKRCLTSNRTDKKLCYTVSSKYSSIPYQMNWGDIYIAEMYEVIKKYPDTFKVTLENKEEIIKHIFAPDEKIEWTEYIIELKTDLEESYQGTLQAIENIKKLVEE